MSGPLNPPRTFTLAPEGFAVVRRRILGRIAILGVFLVPLVVWMALHQDQGRGRDQGPGPLALIALMMPIMGCGLAFAALRTVRRERAAWLSCELIAADHVLTRRISGYPDVTVAAAAVVAIDELPDGTLVVRGRSPNETIGIQSALVGLSELRAILATWRPITQVAAPHRTTLNLVLAVLSTMVICVGVFATNVTAIAVPACLLLIGVCVWSFLAIRRNVHIDPRVKRSAWFLIFPLGSAVVHAWRLLFP